MEVLTNFKTKKGNWVIGDLDYDSYHNKLKRFSVVKLYKIINNLEYRPLEFYIIGNTCSVAGS